MKIPGKLNVYQLCEHCRRPREEHGVDGKCLFGAKSWKDDGLVHLEYEEQLIGLTHFFKLKGK